MVLPPLGRGVVFAGHRVMPMGPEKGFDPNRALSITPDFLDALLRYLKARRIPIVPLSEVLPRLQHRKPELFACFTFDDGYSDNFKEAFPIFKAHQAPFAVYLTAGLLDGTAEPWWAVLEEAIAKSTSLVLTGDGLAREWSCATDAHRRQAFSDIASTLLHADALAISLTVAELIRQVPQAAAARPEMLDGAMIEEMLRSGLVEFGAHTIHHLRLGRQSDAVSAYEIGSSRTMLEQMVGCPVRHFAYPYGNANSYGARERMSVQQCGFDTAVTTRKALLTRADLRNPFDLPRVSLNGHFQDLTLFDVFLSGLPFLGERLRRMAPQRRPRVEAPRAH